MQAYRLRAFTRITAPSSLRRFSSSPSSAAASRRPRSYFSGDESDGGSAVYRHALKFQRPTVIRWQPQLENKVSLIGTVQYPLKQIRRSDRFGVSTFLSVETRRRSNRAFWMGLGMWDEMAEMSSEHLKQNDFIYVSGPLSCHTKAARDGQLRTYYQVTVHELNYVTKQSQQPVVHHNPDETESGASLAEKCKERILLWQVFFANPYEWWDNRKHKFNSRSPDFKHKDTNEALWLQSKDPPWIKRQLELLDSKMQQLGPMDYASSRRRVSTWEYDE